jgi:hypothetical protein
VKSDEVKSLAALAAWCVACLLVQQLWSLGWTFVICSGLFFVGYIVHQLDKENLRRRAADERREYMAGLARDWDQADEEGRPANYGQPLR